ncbi:MAG: hypothetical protein HYR72_23315 [Deltaproteobacteria bacterium]|nr:hypothetical protein [Deltaproteobacteria bacterium]MBI3389029.1 hypothetical protein [Deltaproteobacteria bacterium]
MAAATIAIATAAPALAYKGERRGFDRLTFDQSIAQVQKVYPHMRKLTTEELGAAVALSPFIQRYHQTEVKLRGLSYPVALELRFWKEKLWVIIVYIGGNSADQVQRWLEQRYGKPTTTAPDPVWVGKQTQIVATLKESWIGINDNVLSTEAQTVFMEGMRKAMERQHPAPPAPPAAK